MEDRRSAIVATAAAIVGAIAAIIAYFKGSRGLFVGLLVVALLLIVLMVVVLLSYLFGWSRGSRSSPAPLREPPTTPGPVPSKPPPARPGPAFTSLWRHSTNGTEAPSLTHSIQKNVHHQGWMGDGYSQRSRVQLSILIGCAPIPDTLSTTGLVNSYLDFLSSPAIGKLIKMLRDVEGDVSWHSHWSNGPLNNNAILARAPDSTEAPVAASIFNLNEADIDHLIMFQDNRRAELILIIDLEEGAGRKPFTLAQWHAWVIQALKVVAQFANFLTAEVGVDTYDDPVTVVGVSLQADHDLTSIVDTSGLQSSPAMQASSSFPIYLIADLNGKDPSNAVRDALRAVCDYGLHVLGYEEKLDELRQT